MSQKKRVLFIGEASNLSTGFSTYYGCLLPLLVKTGKYEIAELGSYARQDDPKVQEFIQGRWKFYGVMPVTPEEAQLFSQPPPHPRCKGQNTNQFGEYKFNHVVADFKPDIVIDIRDWWMLEYQERSVFRPFYKWIVMPTVDAEPQAEEWIVTYENAEMVLAYSDYGVHTLRRQSALTTLGRRKMRIFPKAMRPGVDLAMFKPMDKSDIREHWNLSKENPVIGTVMRNQSLCFNAHVLTQSGYKQADEIEVGDRLLTAQGRFMPVTNIWSYTKSKPYIKLQIFGNNIDGPNATSEHKFHFEHGTKSLDECKIKERIKMPVLPRSIATKIDLLEAVTIPKHWRVDKITISYQGNGSANFHYNRYVDVDEDLMRLFGWYCAEGWLGSNETQIQFGINTNEQMACDEIIRIIRNKFGGHVTINDDKEFDSRTLTWSSRLHAKWFKALFGNGSRKKSIPFWIKQNNYSIHLAAAYLEGDGSFYNPDKKNGYILASSFSPKLAHDIRDILLSHGIFTTIGQSPDHDVMKTNLGIYSQWAAKLNQYTKSYSLKQYIDKPRGQNWKNNVEWIETNDQNYFLVPIVSVEISIQSGPFFDFEVQEDHTYNCAGYACDNSRKLYPDLIDGFARMREKYKGNAAVDKAVLLIHSAWPDNQHSYDYPRHIMRLESYPWMRYAQKGIRGSILQTMHCHSCKEPSVSFAMNLWGKPIEEGRIKLPCPHCGQTDASPPSTAIGFSREDLAKLYNLMDLYVQCSICEGDGMPIQEAKACGVPTLVTDYTAMREKGRMPDYSHFEELGYNAKTYSCHKGGDVIDVGRYYHEPETSCIRAHPDIEDLADKMFAMISNQEKLDELSIEARKCAEDNYDWDVLWKQWEYVLDNVKIKDRSTTWDSPIAEYDDVAAVPVPDGLSDEEYVEWLYLNVLKYPSVDPEGAKVWVHHLSLGVPREQIMNQFVTIGNQQSDGSKLRDQIRQQVAGASVNIPKPKQEFV